MLSVEDWAEIRHLRRSEGLPIKAIARVMGVSRNTVKAAVASDRPPKYERASKGSVVDAVEPQIRELLRAYPTMPATVIAERIGWTRSVRVLSGRVAQLRPVYLPPDPASLETLPCGGGRILDKITFTALGWHLAEPGCRLIVVSPGPSDQQSDLGPRIAGRRIRNDSCQVIALAVQVERGGDRENRDAGEDAPCSTGFRVGH